MTALTISADAARPFAKPEPRHIAKPASLNPAIQRNSHRALAEKTLLSEDFSLWTNGSEQDPKLVEVTSYRIPDAMMQQGGWTANGAYEMGGVCGLLDRPNAKPSDGAEFQYGTITTPAFMLYGTATLTFRARRMTGDETILWVAMCDDYYGLGEDQEDIVLTDDWKEYTITATHGSDYDPSYFQFVAMYGHVALDDVRLTFRQDKLVAPVALPAENLSLTEFRANWNYEDDANFRLNVYKLAAPEGGETGTVTYVPDNKVFSEVGQEYTTPATPEDIRGVRFSITPSAQSDDQTWMSLLAIKIYYPEEEKWDWVANLPYYYIENNTYEIIPEAILRGARQVKVEFIQKGQVSFTVDDITLDYAPSPVPVPVVENYETTANSYVVSDIDPEADHFYYVQAFEGDIVSEKSNEVWVDGLNGLQVKTLDPTDVTGSSFTANWQPMPKAADYVLDLLQITNAKEDMPQVTVLEENFDGITTGTVNNPGYDWVSPYDFGANGMAKTGWSATNPCWANGMAGTQGTSYYGTAGLVMSPMLDLSCNEGKGFDVEFSTYVTVDKLEYEGQTYPEGVFAMILYSPEDAQAAASGYLETLTVGLHSGKVHVNTEGLDLHNVYVAFMNMTGTRFFIDEVKITQDLKAGESLSRPLGSAVTDKTSHAFSGLKYGCDHAYAVTARRTREFQNYQTDRSDLMHVPTAEASVDGIDAGRNVISGGHGHILASAPTAMNVYDMAGKTVFSSREAVGSVAVDAGLYLVTTPDGVFRVLVK